MVAEFEPAQQPGRGFRNVGVRDAKGRKSQRFSPAFNRLRQRHPIGRACSVLRNALFYELFFGVVFVHTQHLNPLADLPSVRLNLPDEAATLAVGRELAPLLSPGMVLWLEGDLGAGKTTLVRALLRQKGHVGPVKSPTYSLVEVYVVSSIYWYHFDFYRFHNEDEFADAGLGEYFRNDSVCLVEWPEKAAGYVPPADLVCRFSSQAVGRTLDLRVCSEAGWQCLNAFKPRGLVVAS